MARTLVIVARSHPDLHGYLRARFAGQPEIHVLLDRRVQQRRRRDVRMEWERRRVERRWRPDIDELLRSRSHVIVTIPEAEVVHDNVR